MAHNEKLSQTEQSPENKQELQDIANKQHEAIRTKLEKEQSPEKNHENDVETSSREAIEKAAKLEQESKAKDKKPAKAERQGIATKKQRAANYKKTMKQVQSEMAAPSRTFSKFIHTKPIEKTSEFVGATVARPNAILSGSVMAFIFTLTVFLIARYYGYPLSGFETIAGFALGWVVGILFDYLRVMVTGKQA